jgi:hypothetical protein
MMGATLVEADRQGRTRGTTLQGQNRSSLLPLRSSCDLRSPQLLKHSQGNLADSLGVRLSRLVQAVSITNLAARATRTSTYQALFALHAKRHGTATWSYWQ